MAEWKEAQMYVLEEFKALHTKSEDLEKRVRDLEKSVVTITAKASLIAAIAGCVIAAMLQGIFSIKWW